MKTRILSLCLFVLLASSVAHGVLIGFFPGLDELIKKADAVVILRIQNQVTDFGSPSLTSTHDCFIYQTLKGDIATNKVVRIDLMDTRTAFVSPFAIGSTHLMFLGKQPSTPEGAEYRTLQFTGANTVVTPFGHEKMPEGKTAKEQITSLLRRTQQYNQDQHEKEQAFLKQMITPKKEQ